MARDADDGGGRLRPDRGPLIPSPPRSAPAELGGVGHWRWHVPSGLLEWSDEVYRIFGRDRARFEPRLDDAVDAYHPEDRPFVRDHLDRAVEHRRGFRFAARLVRPDGALRRVVAAGFCRGRDGTVEEVYGVVQDVTELVERQAEADQEMRRMQLAAEAARFAVWDFDPVGDELVWDDRMYPMYGVDRADFDGAYEAWERVVHPEDRARAAAEVAAALEGPGDLDTRFRIIRPRDGAVRTITAHATAIRDEAGRPLRLVGVNRDVTEEVDQGRRLRRAMRHLPVGCLFVNGQGIIEFANEQAEATFGFEKKAMIGRPVTAVLPAAGGQDATLLLDPRDQSPTALARRREVEARARDGVALVVQLGVSSFEVDGVRTLVLSLTDRTTEKTLASQLAHSQRMEAVGHLAGGIAHDFNNLLSVVLGHTEFLEAIVGDDPEARESLEVLRRSATRGAALTQRLLAYSRKQPLAPETLLVEEVLRETGQLLRRTLPGNIKLAFDVACGLPPVRADRNQMVDALVNLSVNSQQAMPRGGKIMFVARSVELSEPMGLGVEGELEPGRYVALQVRDDGPGMPSEVRERAFDPFFTTKGVGESSGLGLSMVYGFVKQSCGHVTLESAVGRGTRVEILLPATSVEPAPEVSAPIQHRVRKGRILVVEDDDEVRRIPTRILREAGFEVHQAADGKAALAALFERGPFDLVFSDVVLSGELSGLEVAADARALGLRTPFLFTTGYAESGVPEAAVLPKPYLRDELLERVDAELERSSNSR